MNDRNFLTALALLLFLGVQAQSQESHIQSRYAKATDQTIVESDLLYVINMPGQFMQLQFAARYVGQGKPTHPPNSLGIQFSSFAPEALYQLDAAHQLRVKADDQVFDFGLLTYSRYDENTRTKDNEKRTNPGVRLALPSVARVGSISKQTGLTVEIMSPRSVDFDAVIRISQAQSVVMKIGETVFPLTATQLSILREFVASITPSDAEISSVPAAKDAPVPADVPSDANHATLEATLKWLKSEIEREVNTKDPVLPRKLEPLDFKTCRIKYRIVPLIRNSPVSNSLVYAIMEYQVDLAQLNPQTVTAIDLHDFGTRVLMTTRDVQPSIKVFTHANENGMTGRTLDEKTATSAAISLKSAEAAARVKVALIHAINLCQARN